jgi:3-deoxy-7-phosphoheptulonate synthase
MAAEYVAQRGNSEIILCERGIRTFETATRNTLDLGGMVVAQQESHLPVIVDPSHAMGHRELVAPMARAAIAAGADGVMVDVHHDPGEALCDGPQALTPADLLVLSKDLNALAFALGRQLV